jgi:hypothetical protein
MNCGRKRKAMKEFDEKLPVPDDKSLVLFFIDYARIRQKNGRGGQSIGRTKKSYNENYTRWERVRKQEEINDSSIEFKPSRGRGSD